MDSASRLYERLGQIPQDPEDPESLEDLIVCAFGAFERYYVCWKTKAGEYKQDGYDLPEALQEWLFPPDGTSRDYPTLQVVFGRGEEYFASDKNGKLEYKEPEPKKPQTPVDPSPKEEKPPLRRSRTISFMSQRSDSSTSLRQVAQATESPSPNESKRRSSSASQSSQISSRPPSTSFSTKPRSDSPPNPESPAAELPTSQVSSRRSSFISHPASRPQSTTSSRPNSDPDLRPPSPSAETYVKEAPEQPPPAQPRLIRRSTRPLSMSFNAGAFPKIVEGKTLSPDSKRDSGSEYHCPCCRHNPSSKPSYADASVQTDPEPLRLDTSTDTTSFPTSSNRSSAWEIDTPLTIDQDIGPTPANPILMGGMLSYFGNPGYQLGDSLMSSYSYFQQPIYEEEVIYGEEWQEAVGGKQGAVR